MDDEQHPRPQRRATSDETDPHPDPDLAAAVSYSLQQSVEARLRGLRNYSRLLRELQRPS